MLLTSTGLTVLAIAFLLAELQAPFGNPFENPFENKEQPLTYAGGNALHPDASIDAIDTENQGLPLPPNRQPDAQPEGLPPADISIATPVPPDGYSFVSVNDSMSREQLPRPLTGRSPLPETADAAPPPDWLDASLSIDTLVQQAVDAGRDWAFGWVRSTPDAGAEGLRQLLEREGALVIGSAGNLLRVRLPGDPTRLRAIAALPEVDGLGAVPPAAKLPVELAERASFANPEQETPVFITLMDDDFDGGFRRVLEGLGAEVEYFDSDIRTYTAGIPFGSLAAVADLDFVLSIEPVGEARAAHDTSVPVMGVDALRTYTGSPGLFSGIGGASVPVAVMDTGLNIKHPDIASNRRSICGSNFVTGDQDDLWVDTHGHGTHVTGTIAGNGYGEPGRAGMAPAVSHIRFAKVLSRGGFGFSNDILRGMDYLKRPSGCSWNGSGTEEVKPLIVNMSLAASANIWQGRTVAQRKLDAVVWGYRQLYVVAQANSGSYAFSDYSAAKNSLSVGAIVDSGELAYFSSYGPTADGRLAPNVVAGGVNVYSTRGRGTRGGYVSYSGTSMASPTVAGIAALLMDAAPAHREEPALVRARLMASAVKPNPWLDDPRRFPMNNSNGPGSLQAQYGLGKVSARTSVLNRDRADGWVSGGAVSELEDGEYAWHDIEVPEDASRLDLVLTWDEPPTDTIANAVLDDIDLWLDRGADCGPGACGEHSSTSRKDNVEWVIVRDPAPGTWRAKMVADRVYTDAPRAALAWTVIRGNSRPNLQIQADKESLAGQGKLTLTVSTDAYVAAGTRLHVDCRTATGPCRSGDWDIEDVEALREDGLEQTFADLNIYNTDVVLGEIGAGESQQVSLNVSYDNVDDNARIYFTVSGWNAEAASTSVAVRQSNADRTDVPEQAPPGNAGFADAVELRESPLTLDLLRATTEAGEPVFSGEATRPLGSAWYIWTAPDSGLFLFDARPDGDSLYSSYIGVDVFRGQSIAGLDEIASARGGAEFFATRGETYRIRVSQYGSSAPLTLRWALGRQAANDNLANAVRVEGGEGSVEGYNGGATLEPLESFGTLAATVWYRWTAPEDGDWRFTLDNENLHVFVLTGERIPELRLVSGYPGTRADFPAKAGTEYRIAVAAGDAFASGESFELAWSKPEEISYGDGDLHQSATDFGDAISDSRTVVIDTDLSVEPDEPVQTGVRTTWISWQAPEDGLYAWSLDRPGLLLNVFSRASLSSGTSPMGLNLVAEAVPDAMPTELVFEATRGERYLVATGMPADSYDAFSLWSASASLSWGPTPDNDTISNAAALVGSEGSVSGSNQSATIEFGESLLEGGHSSVWYSYEASASDWFRFYVADLEDSVMTIYRQSDDGSGNPELVASSHAAGIELDNGDVLVRFEAGVHYFIRLATPADGLRGDFTLHWEESQAPAWLKYVGRLADGDAEAVETGTTSALAFNSDGDALFLATESGLQVFERNPATGELTFAQSLQSDLYDDYSSALLWDPHRARLYVATCGVWRQFSAADGEQTLLQNEQPVQVTGDPGVSCPGELFMDATGAFIYLVHWDSVQVYAVAADGLDYVQGNTVDGLEHALISQDNRQVYALTHDSLLVFDRNQETGELMMVESVDLRSSSAMAISDDGQYLFAVGPDLYADITVFDLKSAGYPQVAGELPEPDSVRLNLNDCDFVAARNGSPAVDVFCNGFVFVTQWLPEAGMAVHADVVSVWAQNRFNNLIPDFDHVQAMAASPDGKHVYLATGEAGILIFERIGNPPATAEDRSAVSSDGADTGATISGGITTDSGLSYSGDGAVTAGGNISIVVTISVDSNHVAEEGDIIVAILDGRDQSIMLIDENGDFIPYDGAQIPG